MKNLENLNPSRVFHYFNEICKIPHGSGNTGGIADFCVAFAKKFDLKYIKDEYNNVIIFKNGPVGYENSEPVILQGHLDMVCQSVKEKNIDFEKSPIEVYVDGDFVKADGTTLGADNGIAVAMIMAVLESDLYSHPPIEAVFTTDEEIGMLGALKLDMSVLKAHRMINLDSEDEGIVTVSCAGGVDVNAILPVNRTAFFGSEVEITLKGLKGGHSGVKINSGRINANLLAGRILASLKERCNYELLGIDGGEKSNAIPDSCRIRLCADDTEKLIFNFNDCFEEIKNEAAHREEKLASEIKIKEKKEKNVLDSESKEKLISLLMCIPNGVMEMSAEINGLVETSLNLGILKTADEKISFCTSVRSNKRSAQKYIVCRLNALFSLLGIESEQSGYYPPWEFNDNSELQELFCRVFELKCGKKASVEAIHAGLECGVFSCAIDGLDCIAVGPDAFDVHTPNESLSISSTQRFFDTLTEVLKQLK